MFLSDVINRICLFCNKISVLSKMAGKKVYNRIKAVLAEKGKTNIWLSETVGVNVTTVSKWCTNTMQPTIETLFEIATALDVDVRVLLVSNKEK